jgi:hypothetical protein
MTYFTSGNSGMHVQTGENRRRDAEHSFAAFVRDEECSCIRGVFAL